MSISRYRKGPEKLKKKNMVEIKIAIERLEAAIGNLSLAGMRRQCNIGDKENISTR